MVLLLLCFLRQHNLHLLLLKTIDNILSIVSLIIENYEI